MPKCFKHEAQYEVEANEKLVPMRRSRALKKRSIKSPLRGGIRMCRVIEEERVLSNQGLSREQKEFMSARLGNTQRKTMLEQGVPG